jgi:hypothetical protein
MLGLSDRMLGGAGLPCISSVHGEPILVLSGANANQTFRALVGIENDVLISSDLGENPRGQRMMRFVGAVPVVNSQDQVQTADGRKWTLTRDKFNAYLTTDFEMTEVLAKG